MLCFGVFAPAAPRVARRLGLERTIGGALLLLLAGILVRIVPGLGALLAGTTLVGAGIGVINVLLPALIKRDFSHRAGLLTGLYSMTLSLGAAAAAGLTVPLQQVTGQSWQLTLAAWGLLAVPALALWVPLAMTGQHVPPQAGTVTLWRQPLAWAVTIFLGIQSLIFYTCSAWLPLYLTSLGYSPAAAGGILAAFGLSGTAASLVVPIIAIRLPDQRWLAVVISAAAGVGLAGLIAFPSSALAWAIVTGVGPGAGISLALLMIVLRGAHAQQTSSLSGMAQSVSYILAAIGPILIGTTRDITGSWAAAFSVLALFVVPQAISGYHGGRNATLS
ncbi:MAG: MFS transporter [Humibacillus sp.]|nr:MFS transporter [Humibacillus sp.]MDN5777805.1 MFS transporter [Humibacillus sp.]